MVVCSAFAKTELCISPRRTCGAVVSVPDFGVSVKKGSRCWLNLSFTTLTPALAVASGGPNVSSGDSGCDTQNVYFLVYYN